MRLKGSRLDGEAVIYVCTVHYKVGEGLREVGWTAKVLLPKGQETERAGYLADGIRCWRGVGWTAMHVQSYLELQMAAEAVRIYTRRDLRLQGERMDH
jgi:hypothetical protein